MSDERFSYEDLPWLQSVVDEEEPRGVSARKMLAALGVVVLAAVLIGAVFFLIGRSDSDVNAPPELIKADPAPYKVRPANPGGLDIAGESETAFETSAGQDTDSRLDLSKMHQEEGAAPPPAEPAKPTTAPEAKQPEAAPQSQAPAAPAPKATGGTGSIVQLGAFQNIAQAERAWTALSARFSSVASLNKMIVPFSKGIRLRAGAASPADARQVCQTLKAAGENCFVAQ